MQSCKEHNTHVWAISSTTDQAVVIAHVLQPSSSTRVLLGQHGMQSKLDLSVSMLRQIEVVDNELHTQQ